MPRLLELFAGSGSVGRGFREKGWDVTALDIEPGHDICCNILDWDYRALPPGHFDCVWASPPCVQYSIARTTAKTPRDLEGADALVQRALDIIVWFDAHVWCLENPYTGLLKTRPCMQGMDVYLKVVTYCKYGARYKKETGIWSNLYSFWFPRGVCSKANPCEHVTDGRHPQTAQRAPGKVQGVRRRSADDTHSLQELYALPAELCAEIADAATRAVIARLDTAAPDFSNEA